MRDESIGRLIIRLNKGESVKIGESVVTYHKGYGPIRVVVEAPKTIPVAHIKEDLRGPIDNVDAERGDTN